MIYLAILANDLPELEKGIPLPKLIEQSYTNGGETPYLIGILTEELQAVLLLRGEVIPENTVEVIWYHGCFHFCNTLDNQYHYPDIEELV